MTANIRPQDYEQLAAYLEGSLPEAQRPAMTDRLANDAALGALAATVADTMAMAQDYEDNPETYMKDADYLAIVRGQFAIPDVGPARAACAAAKTYETSPLTSKKSDKKPQ